MLLLRRCANRHKWLRIASAVDICFAARPALDDGTRIAPIGWVLVAIIAPLSSPSIPISADGLTDRRSPFAFAGPSHEDFAGGCAAVFVGVIGVIAGL